VNILAHKALMVAYGRGETKVDHDALQVAINDSVDIVVHMPKKRNYWWLGGGGAFVLALTALTAHHALLLRLMR
jgi:hypothetical protein